MCSCALSWEHSAQCPTSDYCCQTILELLASGATLGLEDDYTEYEQTVSNNNSIVDQPKIQHTEVDIIYDSTKQDCYTTTAPIHTDRICETSSNKQTIRGSKANVRHASQHISSSRTDDTTNQSLSASSTCPQQTPSHDISNKHLQPSTSTANTKPGHPDITNNASNNNLSRRNRRKRIRGNDNTPSSNGSISHPPSKTTKRTTSYNETPPSIINDNISSITSSCTTAATDITDARDTVYYTCIIHKANYSTQRSKLCILRPRRPRPHYLLHFPQ